MPPARASMHGYIIESKAWIYLCQGHRQATREIPPSRAPGLVPATLRAALTEEHHQEGEVQDEAHRERSEASEHSGEVGGVMMAMINDNDSMMMLGSTRRN